MSDPGNTPRFDSSSRIGIVGAGRLGSSLALALTGSGYRVTGISSRRPSHLEWLRDKLPEAAMFEEPQAVADSSDVTFITASDSAIKQISQSMNWQVGTAVVHCSGALPITELAGVERSGAFIGGFHPLQTFPTNDSAHAFEGITFGIEAPDQTLSEWLGELASNLGGNPIRITPDQRPAYHAAAVMACGLLAGLTGLAAEVWAETGAISRSKAIDALVPLVKTTANSVGVNGLPDALTGPYVRGDIDTVQAHLHANSEVSPKFGAAYSALALATLHIAKEQGGLTEETNQRIEEILISNLRTNCEKIVEA